MAAPFIFRNSFVARFAMHLFSPDYVVTVLRDNLVRKLRNRPHRHTTQKEVHFIVETIAGLIYRGILLSGNAQASLKDILFGLQRYNFPRSETLGLALKAVLEALALSKAESGALRYYIKSLVLTRPVFALEYFLFHANESRVLIREDWDYLFPNHADPKNPCLRFGEYLLVHRLYFTEDGFYSLDRLGAILRYGVAYNLPLTTSPVSREAHYGRAKAPEDILLELLTTLLTCLNGCSKDQITEVAGCIGLVFRAISPGVTLDKLYARSVACRFTNAGDSKDRINLPIKRLQNAGLYEELNARVGRDVTDLKHICRCAVRKRLYENWALPDGIYCLEIPRELKDYLDLLD